MTMTFKSVAPICFKSHPHSLKTLVLVLKPVPQDHRVAVHFQLFIVSRLADEWYTQVSEEALKGALSTQTRIIRE